MCSAYHCTLLQYIAPGSTHYKSLLTLELYIIQYYLTNGSTNMTSNVLHGEVQHLFLSYSTLKLSMREIFKSKTLNKAQPNISLTSNVNSQLTSFRNVKNSGMKFTFSRWMLPLPAWHDLMHSTLNAWSFSGSCLAFIYKNTMRQALSP